MTKGKKKYEVPIELKYEDNGITFEERKEQERVTKKLFDMNQDLAYLVYKVDTDIDFAKKLSKEIPKKASKINKAITKLEALKKTLVITTGDNYVGTAEDQLREKLSKLYSKIAWIYEKPTKAEMLNLKVLEERFDKAKEDYSKIQKSEFKKAFKYALKNKKEAVKYQSFEEFVE